MHGQTWPWAIVAVLLSSLPTAALAAEPVAPSGGAALLLQTLFVLAGVCVLAYAVLRWGLKRFVAPDGASGGAMRVVARLPLEPRRSIIVVDVAGRNIVLGSTEAGFQSLGELSQEEAARLATTPKDRSFRDILGSLDVSRETEGRQT